MRNVNRVLFTATSQRKPRNAGKRQAGLTQIHELPVPGSPTRVGMACSTRPKPNKLEDRRSFYLRGASGDGEMGVGRNANPSGQNTNRETQESLTRTPCPKRASLTVDGPMTRGRPGRRQGEVQFHTAVVILLKRYSARVRPSVYANSAELAHVGVLPRSWLSPFQGERALLSVSGACSNR